MYLPHNNGDLKLTPKELFIFEQIYLSNGLKFISTKEVFWEKIAQWAFVDPIDVKKFVANPKIRPLLILPVRGMNHGYRLKKTVYNKVILNTTIQVGEWFKKSRSLPDSKRLDHAEALLFAYVKGLKTQKCKSVMLSDEISREKANAKVYREGVSLSTRKITEVLGISYAQQKKATAKLESLGLLKRTCPFTYTIVRKEGTKKDVIRRSCGLFIKVKKAWDYIYLIAKKTNAFIKEREKNIKNIRSNYLSRKGWCREGYIDEYVERCFTFKGRAMGARNSWKWPIPPQTPEELREMILKNNQEVLLDAEGFRIMYGFSLL